MFEHHAKYKFMQWNTMLISILVFIIITEALETRLQCKEENNSPNIRILLQRAQHRGLKNR